jgi:type I restriction enzyme S subunit
MSAKRHVPLGELVCAVRSWNPRSESEGETIEYIDIGSVSQAEKKVLPIEPIEAATAPSRARQLVEQDDILVSTVRPNLNAVAMVPPELSGATASTGFCVLRPSRHRLDARYLFHWVRTPTFVAEMERNATGQSYPAVSERIIKQSAIPLPPLEEQKRIAAILDQADALRRLRRRALDRLNALGQSIFHEMFGDPIENSRSWEVVAFGSLCERVTVGVVVKPASHYRDEGVPAIRGTNIKHEGIDLTDLVHFSPEANSTKLKKTRIWRDDLVIVRSGRPGLAAIVPKELDGSNAIDILIATPSKEKATPIFLRDFLNSSGGRNFVLGEIRGQVQQHFNVKSLYDAMTICPPLRLQREYDQRLASINSTMISFRTAVKASTQLFETLQSRAFRGEL